VPKVDYECGIKFNKNKNAKIDNNKIYENCRNFIDNLDTKKIEGNLNDKDFFIFLSSANSCLIEEKHLELFKSALEEKSNNINFEGNVKEIKVKKNTGRSLGFMVIAFLIVIFVLMIYMGVLVLKRLFGFIFKGKKEKDDDDEDLMKLKSRSTTTRNKELDNLY